VNQVALTAQQVNTATQQVSHLQQVTVQQVTIARLVKKQRLPTVTRTVIYAQQESTAQRVARLHHPAPQEPLTTTKARLTTQGASLVQKVFIV
jgi:hypothetical protein